MKQISGIKNIKRKSVVVSQSDLVTSRLLFPEHNLPLLMEPGVPNLDIVSWVKENREKLNDLLLQHGGLLLRGFNVQSIDTFHEICSAISPELLDYVERAAPRQDMGKHVFTSTEYPADQWIPLHHEMSYSHNWPTKLFFYCETAAEVDGYTPITNEREMFKRIPEEIKAKFLEKGIMYVRNYGQGGDMPWWEVFQTKDKAQVEEYLRSTKTDFEWIDEQRLRTRMRRQVVATHPVTGDTVWFNHAYMFHSSNMPQAVREALLQEYAPDELPRNSFYGDGSIIEDEVVETLRNLYHENSILFLWQPGDVMILDNFLAAHGRSPFQGKRKVYVAMSELYTNPDFV